MPATSAPRAASGVPWAEVGAVAAGGAIGGAARAAVDLLLPHEPGAWAWSTLAVNWTGCLLMGVLMTVLALRRPRTRLLRPFAGPGLLGGFTTFSTHTADALAMVVAGAVPVALGYLAATLVGGLAAVWAGAAAAERLWSPGRPPAADGAGGRA
ncbi:fluoride efflux transporter FluC [Streptomonospora nanhaiensis]|uniref:Fluoride-specific ion channel FluC n=1 Tax=Streptomonospora nanhaiensis TaxID=1323731 RepID=A0A853BNW7_9ACTN|nr:CrcB family protein [Streptomonospora nanhaiensis]NYI96700.1 CrcB protein [Streptomonospora nanhaiensis]